MNTHSKKPMGVSGIARRNGATPMPRTSMGQRHAFQSWRVYLSNRTSRQSNIMISAQNNPGALPARFLAPSKSRFGDTARIQSP